MMSSGCKSAVGCVDARVPVRATYLNLYKWPESDAEFVRGLTEKNHAERTAPGSNANNADGRRNTTRFGASPAVVDSYSCRQIFLKSYTFTKEETVSEKTMRCFRKVKERAAACGCPRSDSGNFTDDDGAFIGRAKSGQNKKNQENSKKTNTNTKNKKKNKNNKKAKGCVKRLKEASYSALSSIFLGLLSCSIGVDVEDRRFEGS